MSLSRRTILRSAATAAGGLAAASLFGSASTALGAMAAMPRRRSRLEKLQILQIGVGGSIAPYDRQQLESHPDVVISGLCDVDSNALANAAKDRPQAFTCKDYREAFDAHADKFDAVIVCTPDHNHALPMILALQNGKHCYGQKPLVQQLSEVAAIEAAAAANPRLVTQVGNQRMGKTGRQYAVEILEKDLLGKPVESHVWVNGPPDDGNAYFYYGPVPEPSTPPATIDWPLWLGSAEDAPYRDGLVGLRWRSSWDYGTGQLGDWCTHLLDVPVYAYNLKSPVSVISQTREPSGFYHAQHVASTLAYPDPGGRFANGVLPLHYSDKGQRPSRAALGLPPGEFAGTGTLVVCEGGVLYVEPEGGLTVWRDGKPFDWSTLEGLEKRAERNHWHGWVDGCLGKEAFIQTPFAAGAAMAEAGLLCAKAARYPGQELLWDKASLSFTNNPDATESIVRRNYRPGFEVPGA
jgi:hypothetical protein